MAYSPFRGVRRATLADVAPVARLSVPAIEEAGADLPPADGAGARGGRRRRDRRAGRGGRLDGAPGGGRPRPRERAGEVVVPRWSYDRGVTTGRPGGDTIRAMDRRIVELASRWARPVAITAVVEVITVLGSAGDSHRTGRPFDALAAVLLAVAAGANLPVRRWPWPSVAVALVGTTAYLALGYPTDSPFFVGLLVAAYRSADAGALAR